MHLKIILCGALIFSLVLTGRATSPSVGSIAPSREGADVDKDLTKQISAILMECQKIKPGMTRTELSKVFTTEGGLFTARHQTFVYRGCPYIKVDVEFALPPPNELTEYPPETISKISKPYLEWSVFD